MKNRIIVLLCLFFIGFQINAQEESIEIALNRIVAHINSAHDQANEANIAILGFRLNKGKEITDFNGYVTKELTSKLNKTKRFKVLNQSVVNGVYNTSGIDVWKSVNEDSFSKFIKEANLSIQIWNLVYGLVEDMDDSLAINLVMFSESVVSDTFRIVFLANEVTNKLLKKNKSGIINTDNRAENESEIKLDPIAIKSESNQGAKTVELLDTIPQNIVFKTIGDLKVGVYAAERMGTELHVEVRICKNGELSEMPYVKVWFTNHKGKAFYKQFNTLTYRKLFDEKCIEANVRFVDNTKKVKRLNTLTFELEGLGNIVFENVEVF